MQLLGCDLKFWTRLWSVSIKLNFWCCNEKGSVFVRRGWGKRSISAQLHKVGIAAGWVFLAAGYLIVSVNLSLFFVIWRAFGWMEMVDCSCWFSPCQTAPKCAQISFMQLLILDHVHLLRYNAGCVCHFNSVLSVLLTCAKKRFKKINQKKK